MKEESRKIIQKAFAEYERVSDKATDYVILAIEERLKGNVKLAIYIEDRIIPKLRKKSYKLNCQFYDLVQKLLPDERHSE